MGASFAKAIIPRRPPTRAASADSAWALGWSFPIKTGAVPNLSRAPRPETISEGADSAAALGLLQDGTNTEDRS